MRQKYSSRFLHTDKHSKRYPGTHDALLILPCTTSLLLSKQQVDHLGKGHALLDLSNGKGWVETLGTCPAAVENGVASVQAHAVVESVLALLGALVAGIGNPSV